MHTHFHSKRILYDGSQMVAQWAYRKFGLAGDSIVAFEGPCRVRPARMLDLEDLAKRSRIAGPHMLHWIVEHFDRDLERAVLRQRLLASIVGGALEARLERPLRRDGDDLYDGPRKLSISIAAPTLVSCKIHFAINVRRATGVGVPTEGIATYRIDPRSFADEILRAYAAEMLGVTEARVKARGVP
ncbi:MAG TPA: DUF366 family protein [Planctomycetota bacterium]|nr:DUF366 family protein [Planctomycetota bacterium]